jgi:hypothetical protein
MKIEFFEREHTYRLDGNPADSVTTVLKEEGYIDDTWFRPEATERGTHIHQATELLDSGAMELSDFEGEEIHPYLAAWEKFKAESGYRVLKMETLVAHRLMGYAGTLDRLMETPAADQMIIDIKSGTHQLWHGLQLVAYRLAFIDTFGYDVSGVRVVHLKKTGKYSICDRDNDIGKYDSTVWDSHWKTIMSARNLRKRYGKAS